MLPHLRLSLYRPVHISRNTPHMKGALANTYFEKNVVLQMLRRITLLCLVNCFNLPTDQPERGGCGAHTPHEVNVDVGGTPANTTTMMAQ